ncbi:MAG: DUF6046 domain-containing protein [Dysgonamonadaceae bacterium]|jgi:hypothetical protein|nr:DUF6046 domain-containing protein [Dysgonamonadaceae bacterium]
MIYLDFATGFNLPPFWLDRPVAVLPPDRADGERSEYLGNLYQGSLRMRFADDMEWFTFPLDPVVSVTGKNVIVRRNILKVDEEVVRRGTIKELWSQDDYEVNIAGVFKGDGEMPEYYLRKLRDFCEARAIIEVESVLFSIFGITRLAIEDYSLPFTKGMENQQWSIKAYSDDLFELIVKEGRK